MRGVGWWWLGLVQVALLPSTTRTDSKLVRVTVPDLVQAGSQVVLTCAYTVSPGQYIDSIKWYLNNAEVYRIVPGLTTPRDRVLTFAPGNHCISLPQSGILRPGSHRLVIAAASQQCAGRYICQVTESRPPFKTEQAVAELRVLERPPSPPILSGMRPEYQRGSILNVSCHSAPARPAPDLAWTLNGQKVPAFSSHSAPLNTSRTPDTEGDKVEESEVGRAELAVSESRLVVKLVSASLPSRIVVRCTATIGQLYSEAVVGRAVFLKPDPGPDTVPVLGEPLMSGHTGRAGQWSSLLQPLLLWLLILILQQLLLSR